MWLLIETNTSKSEPLTEYWLSSFSNILILKNALYSFPRIMQCHLFSESFWALSIQIWPQ